MKDGKTAGDPRRCRVRPGSDEAGAIGLSNVRTRLSRFPGCGIEIESAPGQGARVVLSYQKIPVEILTNSIQDPQ